MTTTTKTIESLQTERITLEGMTGEGTKGGVEAAALPAPPPCGRVQRSGEMGIISRYGGGHSVRGERGVVRPRGSGGVRPPTMVGRPTQEIGEQYPKPYTSSPLVGDP